MHDILCVGRDVESGATIGIDAIENDQCQKHRAEGERAGFRACAAAGQPRRTVERSVKKLSGERDSAVGH